MVIKIPSIEKDLAKLSGKNQQVIRLFMIRLTVELERGERISKEEQQKIYNRGWNYLFNLDGDK